MSQKLFEKYKVIDIDTHITEPANVWTDRVASKWGNKVPHIRKIEGRRHVVHRRRPVGGPGFYTMAGHTGTYPDTPMGYDDIPAASYDAKARLELMDEEQHPRDGPLSEPGWLRVGRLPPAR